VFIYLSNFKLFIYIIAANILMILFCKSSFFNSFDLILLNFLL